MPAAPLPPVIVRDLLTRGLPAAPVSEQTVALTRYFYRLLCLRTPAANDAVVGVLHGIAEASLKRSAPPRGFACARGCSTCCSNHVTILAPEAFALARAVRRDVAVRARLGGHVDAQARMDLPERRAAGVSCGLLVDRACSAYRLRPLVCRMFGSFDLAACLTSAATGVSAIPQWYDHATLRSLLGIMLFAGMEAAGVPARGYELNGMLSILIDTPSLEARWYAGDDPFDSQPRDALSDEVHRSIAAFAAAAGLAAPRRVDSH